MTAYMDHKDLANRTIDQARASQIRDGVHVVLDRIAKAEAAAGRAEGSVKLLAATKTRDVGEIMAAIEAGARTVRKRSRSRPHPCTRNALRVALHSPPRRMSALPIHSHCSRRAWDSI